MNPLTRINEELAPILAKISGLTARERLLVVITFLTAISMLWLSLFITPLSIRADQSRAELTALNDRILATNASLQDQILQLAGESGRDRARIAVLQKRIEEVNTTLGDYLVELIDPAEMAEVLEGVLREQSNISIVSISNTTPELISASDAENATVLYRHGLQIEVEGTYAACLQYLEAIETLPWRLYWQVLDLEVIEYPRNRIRIEVSTLSLNEEWIGA